MVDQPYPNREQMWEVFADDRLAERLGIVLEDWGPGWAQATERSRTRRTGSYHLDVHADDRHVASLHAMAHRSSRWHLGEDAWPEEWRGAA